MKTMHLAAASAAAIAIGFGGFEIAATDEGVPFVNPQTLLRSACGKDPASGLKRRAYFQAIGAAEAARLDDTGAGAASPTMQPTPGIALKITTASDEAQSLFDAGLAHMWNFNHGEAINAFRAAQAADPACAMCFWAEAFAWGPNINMPMPEEAVAPAYAAAQKALSLKSGASEKERALIDAVAVRYSKKPLIDRSALDAAFADAMDALARKYPDDDFIVSTAAEANMDTQPWDYWLADGRTPKGRAGRTIELLESVLARNPDYQPAIHLYIHTTEATANPYRAIPYADRLAALSPHLGHLMHMPSHTYARIGRYKQSMDVNLNAVQADEAFLAVAKASPMYEFGYYVHNVHFVMTSAQMAGDGDTALAMAKKLDAKIPVEMAIEVPLAAPIKIAPYYAMVQFADPAAILALENPGDDAPFLKAAWHYARGEALAKLGRIAEARAEAEAIGTLLEKEDFSLLLANLVPAKDILKIQKKTVLARAAAAEGDLASAITRMEDVVALQESLSYMEPPYWYYPAKQTLAALVLKAGDAERAEQLFVESLSDVPNNGWTYYGLAEAYKAQGDKSARKYAEGLMKSSWVGKEKLTLDRL